MVKYTQNRRLLAYIEMHGWQWYVLCFSYRIRDLIRAYTWKISFTPPLSCHINLFYILTIVM